MCVFQQVQGFQAVDRVGTNSENVMTDLERQNLGEGWNSLNNECSFVLGGILKGQMKLHCYTATPGVFLMYFCWTLFSDACFFLKGSLSNLEFNSIKGNLEPLVKGKEPMRVGIGILKK